MQDLINDQVGVLGALKHLREGTNPDYKGTLPPLDMIANNYKDTEIQMMARAGALDPSVVGPAIKRKETLNNQKKQAMAGNTPPSVLNRIMQRNAMAETGIANVAGNNIANPNLMRSGGIVAFNPGGQVQDPYADIGNILTKLKEAREATVKPPTFSGPEAGDFNIGRGLLAMAQGMDPSKGFVGALSGGIGSGIEGLLKSGEEAAARRQKEELAKYTADSGLFDTAVKNLNELSKIQATGKETRKTQAAKSVLDEDMLKTKFGFDEKLLDKKIGGDLKKQSMIQESQEFMKNLEVTGAKDVAEIKANAPKELQQIAQVIADSEGVPLNETHLRKAGNITGKDQSVRAAMVTLGKEIAESTLTSIENEYAIGGVSRDLRQASENPDMLSSKAKRRLDKLIDKHNERNKDVEGFTPLNKDVTGYRKFYDEVVLTRMETRYEDGVQAFGLTRETLSGIYRDAAAGASGTDPLNLR